MPPAESHARRTPRSPPTDMTDDADILLVLPSRPSSVAEVEGFVHDIIREYGLDADAQGNILISLTEAVTNAIRHGNGCDGDKHVRVEVWNLRDKLRITVTDEGSGFEPDEVPDPTAPEFIAREGGRGVFLMRALSDEIEFRRDDRAVDMYYELVPTMTAVPQRPYAVA